MRIIRLVSETDSIFENDFSDELTVKPNGQLALLNTSLKMTPKEITIDSSNSQITYQLTASEGERISVPAELKHQPYTQPNTQYLLDDITLALNNSVGSMLDDANYVPSGGKVGSVPLEVGMQWKCSTQKSSNLVTIEYKNASRRMRTADFTVDNVARGEVAGQFVAKHKKGEVAIANGTQFSGVPVSEGQCQFFMKADVWEKPTNGSQDDAAIGCVLGFTTKDFTSGGTPAISDVVYGVQLGQKHGDTLPHVATITNGVADYATARAAVIADGIASAHYYDYVGASSTENTTFGMSINLGVLSFMTYTKVGTETDERVISSIYLKNPVAPVTRKLYPLIIYLSDADAGVRGKVILGNGAANNNHITLNPFELNLPIITGSHAHDLEVTVPSPPPQVFNVSRNFLDLPDDLARYLGYSSSHLPLPGKDTLPATDPISVKNITATTTGFDAGRSYTYLQYQADETFKSATLNDNFVIEVLSQDLDSYDGQTTERKSILATIPKTEDPNGNLVYEAANVNKVSIRNASEIGMRGMRCRVLTSDLVPIEMNGKSVITVGLYDSENP